MNVFKRNKLRELMIKRRKEQKEISELNSEPLLAKIREKRKSSIKPESLPW